MTTLQRSIQSSKEAMRRWAFALLAVLAFMLAGTAVFASDVAVPHTVRAQVANN